VNAALYPTLPFDPATAFAPVSEVAIAPLVLVVPKAIPVHNLKELFEYVKANPGKANFASQGNASSGHLAMELLKSRTGMAAEHVPYKGSAPALNDLLGGNVLMMFDNVTSSLQHIRAGSLRAIAVAERKRLPVLPDVPTVDESGVPGFELTPWFGIVTTGGTPAPIVDKLSVAIGEVLRTPAVNERFVSNGVELRPSTPTAFAAYIKQQSQLLTGIVKTSGARAD
jgi:tripartite-type tricarboxylate transporter receptor subunit TctC